MERASKIVDDLGHIKMQNDSMQKEIEKLQSR